MVSEPCSRRATKPPARPSRSTLDGCDHLALLKGEGPGARKEIHHITDDGESQRGIKVLLRKSCAINQLVDQPGSGSTPTASAKFSEAPCLSIYNKGMIPDRGAWPVRKFRLGSEPSDDLSTSTTAEERLEMMWPLALEAWSLAGKSLPEYGREATPFLLRHRQAS